MTSKEPVFIVGVMNRSGTNYLANLLLLHPDLEMPSGIWEDYLLARADLLGEYATETIKHWSKAIRDDLELHRTRLLSSFGNGLSSHIRQHMLEGRRPLLKSPKPWNLDYFPKLFPRAHLVLIMRDGRDVVESATRTFSYAPAKHWVEQWALGARTIRRFRESLAEDHPNLRCDYIRFEDLVLKPRDVMKRLLDSLRLSADAYDWSGLDNLPVVGSSDLALDGGKVDWQPVSRSRSFSPIGRWQSWGYLEKRRFKRIAGEELIRCGYTDDGHW